MTTLDPRSASADTHQKENTMTATTAQPTTVTNPHQISTAITLFAIPVVFLGAMWGAGNNPENADWSGFAFAAIVVLHFVQRIRRNAWNRRQGSGK